MPGHLQEGFGCVVTNRFDQLLDDESDPFEILKAAENKKKEGAAAGSTKTAAQAAKQPKKESQKDRKNPLLDKKEESQAPVPLKKEGIRRVGRRPDQQGQPGSQHQGGQGEGRPGDKRPDRRPPRERRFEKPAEDKPEGGGEFSVDKPSGDRPPRGRGGGRGGRGGRGRGMGRGDGFDSRGKRDFDRHSGNDKSNQKTEEKRSGSGSHNWGNVKDEVSEAEQTAAPETTPEGEENAPAGSENKENEVEEVKNEGPKEMTLDEWKAMQDKERTKVEFNIRKPNEGADSQWKKGYVLHKSKSEDRPVGALIDASETEAEPHTLYTKPGTADESSDHHFRKPANDITSQLEINFGDLGRPGRGRGGARGGRGGRGGGGGSRTARGGGRSEKASGVSVPNVDDPEAFPALA
ncbi:plasminogen activator inhibitor 1 RNA-binding protein-like isoform X2 [Seriola lalandi dorsalis]|uniref:plasminogen activator inhibitor 1 RNA-binding protein-like isoform X2 n=1 Tax=Seriola lalandi dorsalis TaxID=1841481 RepID=UPI000C6F842D|nr:plasminogen activator inhibitor 1 RNA-binding protein-like isoform X2 [Seriola lalandi dorsalis]XP_056248225.1 plasminogen activator inhibitor 1 RNA-binding protein isoform X1 [Seriola aureovittata]